LDYQDFYLGKHGTPESYARYFALLAEYNANGQKAPEAPKRMVDEAIRIKDLTADYRHRVLPSYESNYGQHNRFKNLLLLLEERHGSEPVDEFGPRKLEVLRDHFAKEGCSRSYCNTKAALVVVIFQHGVSRELVGPERLVALRSLPPLRKGQGREAVKREKVTAETIKATLPKLSTTVQAMVRLQLATAMRPSELFRMTPAMIDRSGPVWMYRPTDHKTAHRGKAKAVPILGDALDAVAPYLFGDENELCFTTSKGTPWNKDSYRIAVTRAAKAAKVAHWTPYALRHATAQAVRDIAGPEAAQALLGHSRLSTTEIYAQANEAKAIAAAKAVPKLG
jgi:integrase